MQFTAQQLGILLNGTVEGDPAVTVSQLSKIEEGEPGTLTFLANPKYENFLYSTRASVVVISEDLSLAQPVQATLIRVKDPYSSFSVLLKKYEDTIKQNKKGVEQPSFVDPSAKVGEDVYIGAFAYVGKDVTIGDNVKIYPQVYVGDNVKIGPGSVLFPGVKIYTDCVIGKNVTIHSSTVIGSDGFGFAPQADGSYTKVSQIGNVVIGNDVEIGANTCIDRATIGSTIIQDGVKLDNLIQVAHNVEVGRNTVIASQTGLSGSSKIGENVVIGGQVGVVGHISVARGSQIQAKSGVHRSIEEEGKKWAGAPLASYTNNMRNQVIVQRLPELESRLAALEKELKEFKKN